MKILSINFMHDATVCLLDDGKIAYFQKEERLTRIKNDSMPFMSLLELYSIIKKEEIEYCIISHSSGDNKTFFANVLSLTKFCNSFFNIKQIVDVSLFTHHKFHAYSSFYNSNFNKSLVLIADRSGASVFDNENKLIASEIESLFLFTKYENYTIHKSMTFNFPYFSQIKENNPDFNINANIEKYYKLISNIFQCPSIELKQSGLTNLYCTASAAMGENIMSNGKAMGLSSYGEKNYKEQFKNINIHNTTVNNTTMKRVTTNSDLDYNVWDNLSEFSFPIPNSKVLTRGHYQMYDFLDSITPTTCITKENYQYYANYCKLVQEFTQEKIFELINKATKEIGINNICLGGGYANNIVTNAYLKKKLPNVNFYFEPCCDDSGTSIGAAYNLYTALSKENNVEPPKDNFYVYYNHNNTTANIFNSMMYCDKNKLLDMFLQQKTIAIFQGNPEAGQRALGHRSIIFDARNLNGKDIVNKTKKREWYRPFAGVVRKEDFLDYFEDIGVDESPNMMVNFDAKPHTVKEFPSIIHIDNTCRIQTVTNGFFYDFITLLKEKTGCPIILNTSFNLAGEPLVHTVEDAIRTFDNSSLDAVYFVEEKKIILK